MLQCNAQSLPGKILARHGGAVFLVGALLPHPSPGTAHALIATRVVGILFFAAFAVGRRTLTPWIFVAMAGGARRSGFDAPAFAVRLKVFSDIFLRLIKTIVAPLILATLITGHCGSRRSEVGGADGDQEPRLL